VAEPQPGRAEEPPHDVLAAEMFAVPARDPGLNDLERNPHDVLAAEMFAMPAPDPTLHHAPVVLPSDLTGAAEARDVLAAEEFAMPAGPAHPGGRNGWGPVRPSGRRARLVVAMVALGGLVLLVRALRRR
jgi:hypothetical protein